MLLLLLASLVRHLATLHWQWRHQHQQRASSRQATHLDPNVADRLGAVRLEEPPVDHVPQALAGGQAEAHVAPLLHVRLPQRLARLRGRLGRFGRLHGADGGAGAADAAGQVGKGMEDALNAPQPAEEPGRALPPPPPPPLWRH